MVGQLSDLLPLGLLGAFAGEAADLLELAARHGDLDVVLGQVEGA